MNDFEKKLKIGDSPIKYLMRFYIPLMIAFQNKSEVDGWFCSSYIQTKVKKGTQKFWMIYQNFNPFVLRLPCFFLSSIFLKEKQLMKVIKLLVNSNWYISFSADFFYLNNAICYQRRHFYHSVLLYGYDEQKGIVNLCGYCFGSKIECVEVTIENFVKSFFSCKHNKTWIYRRRVKKLKKPKFSKRFFYLGVKGYALARCPLEYQLRARSLSIAWCELYGIDSHIQLKTDLNKLLYGEDKDLTLRIYAYLELARCMLYRLNYIQTNMLLYDIQHIKLGFEDLVEKYRIMLNMFIKFRITNDMGIIRRIIKLEEYTYSKEKKLYYELYITMKKQYGYR